MSELLVETEDHDLSVRKALLEADRKGPPRSFGFRQDVYDVPSVRFHVVDHLSITVVPRLRNW